MNTIMADENGITPTKPTVLRGLAALKAAKEASEKEQDKLPSLYVDGVMSVEGSRITFEWDLKDLPDFADVAFEEKEATNTNGSKRTWLSRNICLRADALDFAFEFPCKENGGKIRIPANTGGTYGKVKTINFTINPDKAEEVAG